MQYNMAISIVIFLCFKFCVGGGDDQFTSEQNCQSGEFDCGDDNFTCIDVRKLCDGQRDCMNGEDEKGDICYLKDGECSLPTISQHMTYKLNYTPVAKNNVIRVPEYVRGVFTCDLGYTSETGNSFVSSCVQRTWEPEPATFKCLKPCQELNTVNMIQYCFVGQEQVDCNTQLFEGAYVKIECQEAFHAPNYDTIVCQRDGIWSIHPEDIKCHPVCGQFSNDALEMLKGKDFPWRVLISEIIDEDSGDSQNFFSGTLIDNTLILTDCRSFNNSLKPEAFIITVNDDVGSWGPLKSYTSYKVKNIHYIDKKHRDAFPKASGSLAIFETIKDIEFGFTVFPICIQKSLPREIGNETQIVTVGNVNQTNELDRDELAILTVISLHDGICLKLSDQRKSYSDQVCGLVNGTMSDADRGTGLVKKDPKKNLYFLEGVFGLHSEPSKIAIFTSLSDYIGWIHEIHEKVKENKKVYIQKPNHQAPLSNMLILFVLLSFVILLAMFLRIR